MVSVNSLMTLKNPSFMKLSEFGCIFEAFRYFHSLFKIGLPFLSIKPCIKNFPLLLKGSPAMLKVRSLSRLNVKINSPNSLIFKSL